MADIPNDLPCPRIDEKCPTNESAAILKLKAQNRGRPINKLPPEILLQIFATGEKAERIWRQTQETEQSYISFSERVSHTCSHWRNVAINDSTLWTYIHVTCPPPAQIVVLYLARAGPTALLDVVLDLRQRHLDRASVGVEDLGGPANCFWSIVFFLEYCNALIDRWRSLQIRILQWPPLVAVGVFINRVGAPALRYLSWRREAITRAITGEIPYPSHFDERCGLSAPSLPNLEVLESIAVPLQLLFQPHSSRFPCLTVLSIAVGGTLFPSSNLCEFLSLHPQLEVLVLSNGAASFQDCDSMSQRISLLSLRSLTIHTIEHVSWVICILHMIDAPLLHHLKLGCPTATHNTPGDQIATYIATGQTSFDDSDKAAVSSLAKTSFYPSLRELDISSFTSCSRNKLVGMLASLPYITHLCVHGFQAACLGKAPWLCPNLVSLRFSYNVYPRLDNVLRCRAEAGFPIKIVQAHKGFRLHVQGELPHTVEIQEYNDPRFHRDHDESEEDGLGWEEDENKTSQNDTPIALL